MLLCDSLEGWDGGGVEGRFKREGTYVYLRLIHNVWQKPRKHCEESMLQLKIKIKINFIVKKKR